MKKLWLFLLILLCKNVVYGLENGFYWMPSMSYGVLYGKEPSEGFQFSQPCHWALLAGQYQFSDKFSVNLTGNNWLPNYYENKWVSSSWNLVAKHRLHPFRFNLFSKVIQPYGQGGGWYACTTTTLKDLDDGGIKPDLYEGSGFIVGIGGYFKISKILVDLSYKRLQPLHIWHKDMLGANIFTISFGLHVF